MAVGEGWGGIGEVAAHLQVARDAKCLRHLCEGFRDNSGFYSVVDRFS